MKATALFFFLFVSTMSLAQTDTVRIQTPAHASGESRFLSTLLYVKPDKKHSHIVDYEWEGRPDEMFGYNYYYHLNQDWHVGGRIGAYTYISHGGSYAGDRLVPVRIEALASYRLYRSICAEAGAGGYTYFNLSGDMDYPLLPTLRVGINATLLRFLFVRAGLTVSRYNSLEFKVLNTISGSVGLRF